MFDLDDLLDYVQDDCVIDIYDCNGGELDCLVKDMSKDEARTWHENHSYTLESFEPIQRKGAGGRVEFGIVFNLSDIEDR